MIYKTVVIRGGASYLSDGDTVISAPLSETDYSAGALVVRAARLFVGEGTVIWWPTITTPDTDRGRKTAGGELVASIREAGWNVSDKGIETGWFTCTQKGSPDVHLGVAQWIDQRKTPVCSLEADAPGTVAMLLALYHRATGAAWRMSAGMAGSGGVRNAYLNRRPAYNRGAGTTKVGGQPLWRWDAAPTGVVGCSWESRWSRDLTPAERHLPIVHQFDITAAYLAAAGNARVGWSAPRNTGATQFEPTAAGYWQVQYGRRSIDVSGSRMAGGDMILPFGRINPENDRVWLTTPVMTYLASLGITPEIHDSWTCERSGTFLRTWTERLRDARWNPDYAVIRPAIKATYSRTIGTFGKPGGRVYRPDWRDTIVDLARINLRRKIDAAAEMLGVLPVRVNVDSVYYADDDPDAKMIRSALAVEDERLGKFRYIRSYSMQEWLDRPNGRHG